MYKFKSPLPFKSRIKILKLVNRMKQQIIGLLSLKLLTWFQYYINLRIHKIDKNLKYMNTKYINTERHMLKKC